MNGEPTKSKTLYVLIAILLIVLITGGVSVWYLRRSPQTGPSVAQQSATAEPTTTKESTATESDAVTTSVTSIDASLEDLTNQLAVIQSDTDSKDDDSPAL